MSRVRPNVSHFLPNFCYEWGVPEFLTTLLIFLTHFDYQHRPTNVIPTVKPPSLLRRLQRKLGYIAHKINPLRMWQPRVLVLGIYLANRKNLVRHIVQCIDESKGYRVTQRWAALNGDAPAAHVRGVTKLYVKQRTPKFVLLNRLMQGISKDDYDFILICDDDILLPESFVEHLLDRQQHYDLALAQPARTHDSYIDHPIVEQVDGLDARQTRFVEIGPVVSLRRDAALHILPFDESSGMGWGVDFVWPVIMEQANLKMGIIDSVPVAHKLRPPVENYTHSEAESQMIAYLSDKPHLSREAAMVVIASHPAQQQ